MNLAVDGYYGFPDRGREHPTPGLFPVPVEETPISRLALRCTLLVVTVATVLVSVRWIWFVHPDIAIQRRAYAVLLSHSWRDTYVRVPAAQVGPLPILLIGLPRLLYVLLVSVLVLPFLALAAPRVDRSRRSLSRRSALWLLACVGLVVPWSQLAWKGHADDALVLVGAGGLLWALERSRPALAVAGLALAALAKPTAVLLAVALSPTLLLALAVALAAVWLPFALADVAGFLHAGRGITQVAPQSLWAWLGVPHAPPPGWLRPVQFLVALGLGAAARRLGGPVLAVLVAFTLRSLLELQPAPAYAASVVALALVADARSRWPVPAFTAAALGAFWTSQMALDGHSGIPRLLFHGVVLALVVAHGWQRSRDSDASGEPYDVGPGVSSSR